MKRSDFLVYIRFYWKISQNTSYCVCEMFGLCKYKNMFGEPNAGLRKYRIADIAIMDTLVVVVFGYLISRAMKWPLLWTLGGLFILGIFAHRAFCVRTGLDRMLFPE